jgi:hypothetical protein
MLASGRGAHPGWLAAGAVGGTEAWDTIEMEAGVPIKTTSSSPCHATGCAIGIGRVSVGSQESVSGSCRSRGRAHPCGWEVELCLTLIYPRSGGWLGVSIDRFMWGYVRW